MQIWSPDLKTLALPPLWLSNHCSIYVRAIILWARPSKFGYGHARVTAAVLVTTGDLSEKQEPLQVPELEAGTERNTLHAVHWITLDLCPMTLGWMDGTGTHSFCVSEWLRISSKAMSIHSTIQNWALTED